MSPTIKNLTDREPLLPAGALHVVWAGAVTYGASFVPESLPGFGEEAIPFAVYSLGVWAIQRLTRRFTWANEGVQIEKANAQAAAIRARNQAATPDLFE